MAINGRQLRSAYPLLAVKQAKVTLRAAARGWRAGTNYPKDLFKVLRHNRCVTKINYRIETSNVIRAM